MSPLLDTFNDRVKQSSTGLGIYALRLLSSLLIGVTFALIFQEIFQYGSFSFTLVVSSVLLCLMRISRHWSLPSLLVYNVVVVLVGLLLKMYVMIAPGA